VPKTEPFGAAAAAGVLQAAFASCHPAFSIKALQEKRY